LQAAGSIASAYTFTLSSQHAIQSIGAFTGQVIPAAETFWPDSTIGQMNRISDMGFQVNKVIAKESSDIVVSFFPIDRFLTPGLKKIFISSPAIFFATNSLILDKTARNQLQPLITPLFDTEEDAKKFIQDLPKNSMNPTADQTVLEFLNRASLNTVRVLIGGSMTIDIDNVPSKIDSVEVTSPGGESLASLFAKPGDIQGVIRGTFLLGGQPIVVEANSLGITDIVALSDGSTDQQLNFKITLTKAIPTTQKKLSFKITKKNTQGATVDSPVFEYQLPATAAGEAKPAPDVSPTDPRS
jgi:hypothetical protein